MKLLVTALLATLVLTGCVEADDYAQAARETERLFNTPEQVGVLPDGRAVMMVTHVLADYHDRHIYFVEAGGTTISETVPNGKYTRQATQFVAPEEDANVAKARQDALIAHEAKRQAAEKLAEARKLEEEAKALLAQ